MLLLLFYVLFNNKNDKLIELLSTDSINTLKELNQKYGVTAATEILNHDKPDISSLSKSFIKTDIFDEVKKDYDKPSKNEIIIKIKSDKLLENVYKLKFNKNNNSDVLSSMFENKNVKAVIALSPGEYFLPGAKIQDLAANLEKPVFITSSKSEFPYASELSSSIPEEYLTLFQPQLGEGSRGASALTKENAYYSEYWLALILFFKDLI